MSLPQKHIIRRQRIEVAVKGKQNADELQEEISRIFHESLLPILERELDRHSPAGTHHEISKLEIDLGKLDPENLEISLIRQFAKKLGPELSRKIGQEKLSKGKNSGSTTRKGPLELLLWFLRTGTLPWWAPDRHSLRPPQILEEVLSKVPDLLKPFLPALVHQKEILKRMVYSFPDLQLMQLWRLHRTGIAAVENGHEEEGLQYFTAQYNSAILDSGIDPQEMRQARWQFLWGQDFPVSDSEWQKLRDLGVAELSAQSRSDKETDKAKPTTRPNIQANTGETENEIESVPADFRSHKAFGKWAREARQFLSLQQAQWSPELTLRLLDELLKMGLPESYARKVRQLLQETRTWLDQKESLAGAPEAPAGIVRPEMAGEWKSLLRELEELSRREIQSVEDEQVKEWLTLSEGRLDSWLFAIGEAEFNTLFPDFKNLISKLESLVSSFGQARKLREQLLEWRIELSGEAHFFLNPDLRDGSNAESAFTPEPEGSESETKRMEAGFRGEGQESLSPPEAEEFKLLLQQFQQAEISLAKFAEKADKEVSGSAFVKQAELSLAHSRQSFQQSAAVWLSLLHQLRQVEVNLLDLSEDLSEDESRFAEGREMAASISRLRMQFEGFLRSWPAPVAALMEKLGKTLRSFREAKAFGKNEEEKLRTELAELEELMAPLLQDSPFVPVFLLRSLREEMQNWVEKFRQLPPTRASFDLLNALLNLLESLKNEGAVTSGAKPEELKNVLRDLSRTAGWSEESRNRLKRWEKESEKPEKSTFVEGFELREKIQEVLKSSLKPIGKSAENLTEKALPKITDTDALYPLNAGLVLAWPFLGQFFERLGLADKLAFHSEADRNRAALFLHYLCYKSTEIPEPALLLNKLICGIPLTEPIPLELKLSEEEEAEVEGLIGGICSRSGIWDKLKPDEFRSAWLRREGVLRAKEGHFLLHVEAKPYDVLLPRLPWGFNMVRLPWMERMLLVEWDR